MEIFFHQTMGTGPIFMSFIAEKNPVQKSHPKYLTNFHIFYVETRVTCSPKKFKIGKNSQENPNDIKTLIPIFINFFFFINFDE